MNKLKQIITYINDNTIYRHHCVIVLYNDYDKMIGLIRSYERCGVSLVVSCSICSGGPKYGRWRIKFVMTNAQYRDFLTRLQIKKFDWRVK